MKRLTITIQYENMLPWVDVIDAPAPTLISLANVVKAAVGLAKENSRDTNEECFEGPCTACGGTGKLGVQGELCGWCDGSGKGGNIP